MRATVGKDVGCACLWHGLDPGRSIDMNDAGNAVAPLGPDILGHQHVRAFVIALEYLGRAFVQHDRCERPKGLTMLHALVQLVLHFIRARIGDNAAVAKCARAKFRAALEPAKNIAIGKELGGFATNVIALLLDDFKSDDALA